MLGLAHFQILRAGDLRIGLLEIGRLQEAAAAVALVAAGALEPAMRTGALDIAVGQEAVVIDGKDLVFQAFLDQALGLQHLGEMLGQLDIGGIRGAAEHVIGQREARPGAFLDLVLLVTIFAHALAGRRRSQFGRRAVLVGGADVKHVMALGALEAGIDIRRQHRSGQIPQMLDAIDVRQSAGDQYTGHFDFLLLRGSSSKLFASKASRARHRLGGRDIQARRRGGNRKCREFSD